MRLKGVLVAVLLVFLMVALLVITIPTFRSLDRVCRQAGGGQAGHNSNIKGGVSPARLPLRKPIVKPTIDLPSNTLNLKSTNPVTADKWAVIIGISDYFGTQSDLKYCDDDALDVYNALTTIYGFPPDQVVLLLDSMATTANIQASIDWLIANEGPNSTVVFYYSGHGSRALRGDTDRELIDESIVPWELSRIYDGELALKFKTLESSKVWVGFDSCYAGGMDDVGITGLNRIDTQACGETQLSYESNPLQNGYFTYFMIDAAMLQGKADANGDGVVSIEEAFKYAKNSMRSLRLRQRLEISDRYPGEMIL
ncbi:MAG: caspase family protein [Actinomycetota bacterium]